MFVSYWMVLYGAYLCDVYCLCVGCLNVLVWFRCDLLCRGVWSVVCVVLSLCACWLYVLACFVCDRLCDVE